MYFIILVYKNGFGKYIEGVGTDMITQYIWEGVSILNRSILVGSIIYLIILIGLYLTKKRRKFEIKQIIPEILLNVYTIVLLRITGIIGIKFYFDYIMSGFYNLNLIPFRDVSIMMVFLNFLLFIPYGVLLPCIFKKLIYSWKKVFIIGFITSLSIEVLQLFGGRFAEIDDVLMNSIGTLVGFMVYTHITNNILRHENLIKGCDPSV